MNRLFLPDGKSLTVWLNLRNLHNQRKIVQIHRISGHFIDKGYLSHQP